MTKQQQDESIRLLKATLNLLKECDNNIHLDDIMYFKCESDGVSRDGTQLMEDINTLIECAEQN